MSKRNKYNIMVSGTAHELFPMETLYGLLWISNEEALEIPKHYPFKQGWQPQQEFSLTTNSYYDFPQRIDVVWLSIVEEKFYWVDSPLSSRFHDSFQKAESMEQAFESVVVGMAPYGQIAVWLASEKKSVLMTWLKGHEVEVDMEDFLPNNPEYSLKKYCAELIDGMPNVKEKMRRKELPAKDIFDNYMKQYNYRYLPLFEHWNKDNGFWLKSNDEDIMVEFDYIEEALFDGTHDKRHDDELMNYHEAGKPKKLVVKWYIMKSEYTAYFWFEDEVIRSIFDRFYGVHQETKTDFMIRIDSEKNKYELALYRYGLKEPQVISESAYQILVFKNKFEYYRSENYNQPKGAWIW